MTLGYLDRSPKVRSIPESNTVLGSWLKLISNGERLIARSENTPNRTSLPNSGPEPTDLQRYVDFATALDILVARMQFVGLIILFLLPFLLYFSFLRILSFTILLIYVVIIPLLWVLSALLLRHRLRRMKWRFLRAFTSVQTDTKGQFPVIDLVDGLCTRKATRKEDSAFAVHGVLEHMTGSKLPLLSYSYPLGQIFKQITIDILETTKTYNLLVAAALNNVTGNPSWVPD